MNDLIGAFAEAGRGEGPQAVETGALVIGAMAIITATEDADDLDGMELVYATEERLNEVAAAVEAETPHELMLALFGSGEFSGNIGNYYDPDNSLLPSVLKHHRGNPITLSTLAIAIGQRLDIALEGVSMPGHFLLSSPEARGVWFDPFHAGAIRHHDDIDQFFHQLHGDAAVLMPEHLQTVGPKAILGRMLNNLRFIYTHQNSTADLEWVSRLTAALRFY